MDLTQLLLRLFVKDYRNTEDPAVRTRYGKLAGIVGIVCNVLLSAGKLLAGTLSGAVSITADGSEQPHGRCVLARDAAGLPPGGAACG